MSNNLFLKVVVVTLATIFITIAFEVISFFLFYKDKHEYEIYLSSQGKIVPSDYPKLMQERSFILRNFTNQAGRKKLPHPYLGYTYSSGEKGVNRDGFNHVEHFRQPRDDEFVIGIFGGSVAGELAEYMQKYELEKIRKRLVGANFERFKNKKIRIINFSVSAYKQPQQFISSVLYSDIIHLSINLDGYNEVAIRHGALLPVDYPQYSQFFYIRDTRLFRSYYKLIEEVEGRSFITLKISKHPILRKSTIVYLWWKAYLLKSAKKEKFYHTRYLSTVEEVSPYYSSHEHSLNKKSKSLQWVKYLKKQNKYLNSYGVPNFYFLQPNQYVEGSKIFSEEETKQFIVVNSKNKKISEDYVDLISQAKVLRINKYPVWDLTNIFNSVKETVYRDSTCHLNSRGNSILSNYMMKEVAKYYQKNNERFR